MYYSLVKKLPSGDKANSILFVIVYHGVQHNLMNSPREQGERSISGRRNPRMGAWAVMEALPCRGLIVVSSTMCLLVLGVTKHHRHWEFLSSL